MSTVPNDVDTIRRQMAEIRRELHEDVQSVVTTAEAVTDWHRYITAYPWASLGAAFVLGYLIVPHKSHKGITSKDVNRLADLASGKVHEAVETAHRAAETTQRKVVEPVVSAVESVPPDKRRKGLIAAGIGMATPLIWKAAQGYALKYAEQWLNQQMAHMGPPADEPSQMPTSSPRPSPGGSATYPYPGGGPSGPRPDLGKFGH